MFVVPKPCLDENPRRSRAAIQTLDRLARRHEINDPAHLAEAIAVVVWNPETGEIMSDVPDQNSHLRLENFSVKIEEIYKSRYQGLPPHNV